MLIMLHSLDSDLSRLSNQRGWVGRGLVGRGLVGRGSWVVGPPCVVVGPHIYTSCMHNFTLFPMPSHNSGFVRGLFLACTLSDS